MNKNLLSISIVIISTFLFNSCAINPVTGKKQLVLMSEAQEIQMGKDADPQIIAEYGLYENQELQNFISAKGKQMAAISHRPNIEYNFRIVDSEVVNAFAIPGYVYFTRGIMANFNNEAEFAGVLGHEIGHITARHTVSQQANATLGQIGLLAGMIISPTIAQYGQQASQGLSLLFLKFGRDAERQADELGVEYSSKINYDAHQMADFFGTLERISAKNNNQLPDFLSTHPNPGERMVTVDKLATQWQRKEKLTDPIVARNSYLKKIDGIVYGEDPKQGFVENNTFYHPVLKFQFPIPANWKTNNSPQSFQMAEADGKALMMLSLAPGKTLQEAANAVIKNYNLTVVQNDQTTINGLSVLRVIADQPADQQKQSPAIRTLSYFIAYGNNIYHMIGVTDANSFSYYDTLFSNTMSGFRQLTDQEKINRKPDRIKVITATGNTTLGEILTIRGINDGKKREDIAILNGMTLKEPVVKGLMVKVIDK
ncbi:MAG: M48 family metalloprotease [Bacteroidetes bacterium]|nr:M48 family metalloprotease [Bacteroidota bacterium]MBU1371180.1 M48 family metalloprotease [Bacteroidota bacterium]MBU1486162.1 M48 family metalloprotease [Bacteroidota bacterium]MBU1760665.1 M48 family metalloprotease [Bacteroidota bacterium]MBU2267040.1 M48 family metalloprotease [Bacteroidota bacterium]